MGCHRRRYRKQISAVEKIVNRSSEHDDRTDNVTPGFIRNPKYANILNWQKMSEF